MTPRATYRLQLRREFTFADAEALVPYLAALGISHVYASPITTARRGSSHGYDVVDPTRVSPELGGEEGLRRLADRLREHAMGLIVDIVPNHMGVAGDENRWWLDVLEHGEESRFARFFDIDWSEPVLLPVLGAPLSTAIDEGAVRLVEAGDGLALQLYGETRYPLRPDDPILSLAPAAALAAHDPTREEGRAALLALAGRQHYRLAFWRTANDCINWRRFFAINELAGLRAENPEVFEASHELILRLYGEGVIDGVRVDHVDGLSDPAGYCHRLKAALQEAAPGRQPYIVVEKILAHGEHLPAGWDIDGTSGYDFMTQMGALLTDPAGLPPLTEMWTRISGRTADFAEEEFVARRQILSWQFDAQLKACVRAFSALAASSRDHGWITSAMLQRGIERLLWAFPVYRTYGLGDSAPPEDDAVRQAAGRKAQAFAPPGETDITDLLLDWLAGTGPGEARPAAEAVRRFQQLSAPIAAKSVEDTAFYRHGVLLSANEVGSDPAQATMTIGAFHAAMVRRAATMPRALLPLATHDHKRGADARARLAVISTIPEVWSRNVERWMTHAGSGVDPADFYMLMQTLVGAWDDSVQGDVSGFLARIHGWQDKALREAQLRSSWAAPDEAYEDHYKALATSLLTSDAKADFRAGLRDFIAAIEPAAQANSLAQVALQLTVPGTPDIYQGTELPDHSLVDPDNRRAVDYPERRRLLEGGTPTFASAKLRLTARLLGLRREHPALFANGDYTALPVTGPRADHLVAFERSHAGQRLTCIVPVRVGAILVETRASHPPAEWWGDTAIHATSGAVERADRHLQAQPVSVRID